MPSTGFVSDFSLRQLGKDGTDSARLTPLGRRKLGVVENLPDAISAAPEFAPGLILGALAGIAYGLYEDFKADDGIPHRWWQMGAIGAVLGVVAQVALITLS